MTGTGRCFSFSGFLENRLGWEQELREGFRVGRMFLDSHKTAGVWAQLSPSTGSEIVTEATYPVTLLWLDPVLSQDPILSVRVACLEGTHIS